MSFLTFTCCPGGHGYRWQLDGTQSEFESHVVGQLKQGRRVVKVVLHGRVLGPHELRLLLAVMRDELDKSDRQGDSSLARREKAANRTEGLPAPTLAGKWQRLGLLVPLAGV